MVNNTLYTLLNSALAESMGEHAITIKDTTTFISAGHEVLSTSENKDAFYQKLADRIGAVLVDYKKLVGEDSDIRKDPMRFGMAMQQISVARMNRAVANKSWGAQANPFAKDYDDTDIEVRYYSKRGTFEGDTKLVYDYQLETAFTNEMNMMAFVQAIFTDMDNGMEKAKMELDKETRATMIAYAKDASGITKEHTYKVDGVTVKDRVTPKTAFNLLADYNNRFGKALTVDNCMYDEEFMLYASAQIDLYVKKTQKPKAMYNPAISETWTEKSKLGLKMLSEFVTNFDRYLKSKIYHDNFVALPQYSEVDSWQGSGESDLFADTSKIAIKIEDGLGGYKNVEMSGVVACLYDIDACGTNYIKPRTKSVYNPASELTNYFPKCDYGAYVLPNHNCIVFYIADEFEIVTSVGEHGTMTPAHAYVKSGDNLALAITPDEGYVVNTFTVDGVDAKSSISDGVYTLSNVTDEHNIAVTFIVQS